MAARQVRAYPRSPRADVGRHQHGAPRRLPRLARRRFALATPGPTPGGRLRPLLDPLDAGGRRVGADSPARRGCPPHWTDARGSVLPALRPGDDRRPAALIWRPPPPPRDTEGRRRRDRARAVRVPGDRPHSAPVLPPSGAGAGRSLRRSTRTPPLLSDACTPGVCGVVRSLMDGPSARQSARAARPAVAAGHAGRPLLLG